jgi:hypothetical protein
MNHRNTGLWLALMTSAAAAQQLEPIPLALPKPLYESRKVELNVPNLEKPTGQGRPAFLAPAGTRNVARGKPVTSSDEEPIVGDLEMVTDGNKDGTDGTYVELRPGRQHVTIDLQSRHLIYAIVVWHYHKQPRVYYDVVVQAASDAAFTSGVRTLFNNDHDNTTRLGLGRQMNYIESAEGRLIDARGVEARYVRLYSHGNSSTLSNDYVEVEVYGKPLP